MYSNFAIEHCHRKKIVSNIETRHIFLIKYIVIKISHTDRVVNIVQTCLTYAFNSKTVIKVISLNTNNAIKFVA